MVSCGAFSVFIQYSFSVFFGIDVISWLYVMYIFIRFLGMFSSFTRKSYTIFTNFGSVFVNVNLPGFLYFFFPKLPSLTSKPAIK